MFDAISQILEQAIRELSSQGITPSELIAIRKALPRQKLPFGRDLPQFLPYNLSQDRDLPGYVPPDLGRCQRNTIFNCCIDDVELVVPAGFVIQVSATRPESFAMPYYLDPVGGNWSCKDLHPLATFSDRGEWQFDLSFVGHRRSRKHPLRESFLRSFESSFVPYAAPYRLWVRFNDDFFFRRDPQARAEISSENRYIEAIRDSRFVLCPRGGGANSIRFFETLAVCNIPIFVGEQATKFPLDWIIDWEVVAFRISDQEAVDRTFASILALTTDQINVRRRYIFRIYHQFLALERRPVFEALVWLRAAELLAATPGYCATVLT